MHDRSLNHEIRNPAPPSHGTSLPPGTTILEGIVALCSLDGDPAAFGEGFDSGFALESSVAAILHSSLRQLPLVGDGGTVDVAAAAVDAHALLEPALDVSRENRGRPAVFRVDGQLHGLV